MSSQPPFRVRVRLPSSKQETLNLTRPVTIRVLVEAIKPFVDVELSQINIKQAYPPKSITLGTPEQWDRDVSEIGISNGDGLVVSISENEKKDVSPPSDVKPVETEQPVKSIVAPFQNPFGGLLGAEKRPLTPSRAESPTPAKRSRVDEEPPEIPVEGGTVVLRIMEDDNSCMFNALIYCVGKGEYKATELRQIVVRKIREDPLRFDDATLGRTVDEYCAWISRSTSWGGEIELAILSEHFAIGIDSVDVKTGHVFSYGESYPMRCILIYSGIHYDALAYTFIPSMPDADVTVYQISPPAETSYDAILEGAKKLALKLKAKGYHVDTATFNIVCEQCGKGFIGEKEAIKHAEETGHTAFGQIPVEEDE